MVEMFTLLQLHLDLKLCMGKPAATYYLVDNIVLYKCKTTKFLFARKDQLKIWLIKV